MYMVTAFKARIMAGCLLLASLAGVSGSTVTNVTPVNVTPRGFSILCRASASVSLSLFADAVGASNVTKQLGIESFPVHTGVADLPAGYSRRQSQIAIRQKTAGFGLVLVRVTGCTPATSYFYRLGDGANLYPASGSLPSVTTETENTFVIDDEPLLIDFPGLDNLGRIVTVTHTNASHPLAAVIGDGAGTNQAFFNLNDLFALAGGGNLAPLGAQTFSVHVLGPGGADTPAQFTVSFGLTFNTGAGNNTLNIGNQYLVVGVGSAVLLVGQSSNVPVTMTSSDALSNLDLTLGIDPGHLSGMTLTSLAPEVDPAGVTVTVQSSTNVVLHLPARSGQSISGSKTVANFAFQATPGQRSAFVPLSLRTVAGKRTDSSVMTNLSLNSGRLVLVGDESLLEAAVTSNKSRTMTLYAKPYFTYALEYRTNLTSKTVWTRLRPMAITELATSVTAPEVGSDQVFYRAVQYNPDPAYVEAHQDGSGNRYLTLFGKPGSGYVIQTTPSLNAPITWTPVTNYALYTPFTNIPVSSKGMDFFRVGEMFASPPVMNVVRNSDGSADVTLFGRAGYAYMLNSAPSNQPSQTTGVQRIGLDNSFLAVHLTNINSKLISAVDYAPNPSVLELVPRTNGSAGLRLFGRPGHSYSVETSSAIGAAAKWTNYNRVPMGTSYTNLPAFSLSQQSKFFRVVESNTTAP
jgi:hypothetical protein